MVPPEMDPYHFDGCLGLHFIIFFWCIVVFCLGGTLGVCCGIAALPLLLPTRGEAVLFCCCRCSYSFNIISLVLLVLFSLFHIFPLLHLPFLLLFCLSHAFGITARARFLLRHAPGGLKFKEINIGYLNTISVVLFV